MARKHSNIKDDPPAASSSGEEEVEEVEEEDEEMEDAPTHGNNDGSESEEGGDDGEEEEEEDEEEEEEEEEEDEDDEDDDKKELKTEKVHHEEQPSQSKPVPKTPSSRVEEEDEDEDEDETESDSDHRSPGLSEFTIRKHFDSPKSSVSEKPSKRSKDAAVDKERFSPELVSSKRPAEADLYKDPKSTAKRSKTENGGVGGDEGTASEKKSAINRVWDESSEIAILKGMIEFQEDRGVDPNSDSNAFYEFMKDKVSVEVTKTQLMDKVRRLKLKYKNNVCKAQKGENPVFSKPHEHRSFELSKRIWGDEVKFGRSPAKKKPVNENPKLKTQVAKPKTEVAKPKTEVAKDNGNAEVASLPQDQSMVALGVKKEDNCQEQSFSQLYPFLDLSLRNNSYVTDLVSRGGADAMASCLRCLEKSTLDELEAEWRKQIIYEAEVCMKRSTLVRKQVELVSNWNARRG